MNKLRRLFLFLSVAFFWGSGLSAQSLDSLRLDLPGNIQFSLQTDPDSVRSKLRHFYSSRLDLYRKPLARLEIRNRKTRFYELFIYPVDEHKGEREAEFERINLLSYGSKGHFFRAGNFFLADVGEAYWSECNIRASSGPCGRIREAIIEAFEAKQPTSP